MGIKNMKAKPLSRLQDSITHGNLWLSILSLASKKPVYAYVLPVLIEKKFGFTPSRLMVYLVLYKLEAEGLLIAHDEKKRKYYIPSKDGRKCLVEGKKALSKWAKGL